jgi:hypothetical protein
MLQRVRGPLAVQGTHNTSALGVLPGTLSTREYLDPALDLLDLPLGETVEERNKALGLLAPRRKAARGTQGTRERPEYSDYSDYSE